MRRSELILAAMAPAGTRGWFDPARIQQLLFLIDIETLSTFVGTAFRFDVDEWGPVDPQVCSDLRDLTARGQVQIDRTGDYEVYALTPAGVEEGRVVLRRLPESVRTFIKAACPWVLTRTIPQILREIRARHPERAAAISLTVDRGRVDSSTRSPWRTFLRGMGRAVYFHRTQSVHALGESGADLDGAAIGADWIAVGRALEDAIAARGPAPPFPARAAGR